jgi:membrane fusion protein (multidrug efflux system)
MAQKHTPEEEPKKKPNRVLPIILGIVLIGGIIFGIKEYIYFSKHVDTDDAQIDGDISPVVARVGGYVDSIYFQENEHVNADQVLVRRFIPIQLIRLLQGLVWYQQGQSLTR